MATSTGESASGAASWDLEADVVVIGFGGAGVSAAIEAVDQGASVLAFDRFNGGGATRKSAGVMYSGGGTKNQKQAGFDDTPDEMFNYLKQESIDTISQESLRAYCDQSVANFEWVEGFGVPYPEGFEKEKTSYPNFETTLYYSGNESCPPFNAHAKPAARGHRAIGDGLTGHLIFDRLRDAALKKGVVFHPYSRCTELICDDKGHVIGVEILQVRSRIVSALIWLCAEGGNNLGALSALSLGFFSAVMRGLERFSRRLRVRARGGVVIAAGGFIFNRKMTREHLPECSNTMRLGTVGDDGSGIRLGQRVGGAVGKMNRSAIWLFFDPPKAFLRGMLVDREGERVCNEQLYGATLAMHMVAKHGGKALLVIDQGVWDQVRTELRTTTGAHFQVLTAFTHLYWNRKKGTDIADLERKCGLASGALANAIDRYHFGVEAQSDAKGKDPKYLQRLDKAPYYAINVDLDNWRYLSPAISLGGLRVDGMTARVLTEEGSPVPGLYAVGRSAVGLCSHSYVTGLSIGGAIFSGRNAGRHAAAAATTTTT